MKLLLFIPAVVATDYIIDHQLWIWILKVYIKNRETIEDILKESSGMLTHDKSWVQQLSLFSEEWKSPYPVVDRWFGTGWSTNGTGWSEASKAETYQSENLQPLWSLKRQKAIHGSTVKVPLKLQPVVSLLPRLPATAEVVALKLKGELFYRGHYMHEYIQPKKVMEALNWLKNNPLYKDIIYAQTGKTGGKTKIRTFGKR